MENLFIIILLAMIVALLGLLLTLTLAFYVKWIIPLIELITKGKDYTPWKGEHPDFYSKTLNRLESIIELLEERKAG
jgi:hypothetical protein